MDIQRPDTGAYSFWSPAGVRPRHWALFIAGAVLVVAALLQLERGRAGVVTRALQIGQTPATLYSLPDTAPAPAVVISHGFAGSRQLMQAFSYYLARAGYHVVAFDALGHGRNPEPMAGDVTAIDGTTALLVAETRRVLAAVRDLPGVSGGVALLGHSMASDIVVRAAQLDPPVDTVIAISPFSEAVSAESPRRLLLISGAWESRLREIALKALRQVDAGATEGETVTVGDVSRRAVASPGVEHVGVLFSPRSLRESLDWLNAGFQRDRVPSLPPGGGWILALLLGIVLTFRPVAAGLRMPPRQNATAVDSDISAGRWWLAVLLPTLLAPAIGATLFRPFLPVLVADYLLLHLLLYGALQAAALRHWPLRGAALHWRGMALLLLWGLVFLGLALDRYAASFFPTPGRLWLILALLPGAVLFLLADAAVTRAGRGALWQRVVARLAFLVSLGLAAALRPEDLGFVLLVLPVVLLFFLVHGTLGRWLAQAAGGPSAGLALGLVLAWTLGVSFPQFAA
jgi:hypothetical protein